jgi:hypothetical protein
LKRPQSDSTIRSLLSDCVDALAAEIESVRQRPSEDVLYGGVKVRGAGEYERYSFATANTSLRYAEEVKTSYEGDVIPGILLEFDEKQVILGFENDLGLEIRELYITWENDFVLRRLQDKLNRILDRTDDELLPIRKLLSPETFRDNGDMSESGTTSPGSGDTNGTKGLTGAQSISSPHHRRQAPANDSVEGTEPVLTTGLNAVQVRAVQMAVSRSATYIWGPPGTGKTATLGFIMANFILRGQRVLFVSNTNRAVDVGMLSLLEALRTLDRTTLVDDIIRFGELVLGDDELEKVSFDIRFEKIMETERSRRLIVKETADEFRRLEREAAQLISDGKSIPALLQARLNDLAGKLNQDGTEHNSDYDSGRSRELTMIAFLSGIRLIGTTLARVCTSDLIDMQQFDAVVIDEASMAGLPFSLVMASKAHRHLVVTGDPMQLPPIALTGSIRHKALLEQDIFSRVSKAEVPEDLFRWHDKNPDFTCFFDTQYRLNSDLAGIISDVFYEGRLKTGKAEKKAFRKKNTIRIINTEHQNPFITSQGEKGFRPVNDMHLRIVVDEVHRLVIQENIPANEIGVIVPFRSSVWDYRKHLNARNMNDVEVGTIHTFQGREKQVIIFDTVMSGQSQFGRMRHFSVRPFDEEKNGMSVPRLLNVAFSRCSDQLILVADFAHMRKVYKNKFLGRLIGRMVKEERS